MAYFADLTPVAGFPDDPPHLLTVGWLDKEHLFPTEVPDAEVVYRLEQALWDRVWAAAGHHLCEFCEGSQFGIAVKVDGVPGILGSAEIRVPGDGVTYACPDLIYHYVRDHHYRPPDEFVRALRRYERRRVRR